MFLAKKPRPAVRSRRLRPGIEMMEDRQLMASLYVTNLADSGPGSLRAEIQQAEATQEASTIGFASWVSGAIELQSALPDLTGNLTIQGPGAGRLAIDRPGTAPQFRILSVDAGATAAVSGLTLSGGLQTGYNGANVGLGGGVLNLGTLTLDGCAILGCTGQHRGGGIENQGTCTINQTTVSGCSTLFWGGGIDNSGILAVTSSTIANNRSYEYGGAISSSQGVLTVLSSTIDDEKSPLDGRFGLIFIEGVGTQAIAADLLSSDTIRAAAGASSVYNYSNMPVYLQDSVVVGRLDGSGFNSLGHNLIQNPPADHSAFGASDKLGVDPLLGPLGSYGGPTQTIPLLPGSPAIDAGDSGFPDQRGINRSLFGSAPDIGAFESRGFTIRATSVDNQTANLGSSFAPLVVQVSSAYGEPVDGGQITFSAPAGAATAFLNGTSTTVTYTLAKGGVAWTYARASAASGSYVVSVTTPGIVAPALFHLKNRSLFGQ